MQDCTGCYAGFTLFEPVQKCEIALEACQLCRNSTTEVHHVIICGVSPVEHDIWTPAGVLEASPGTPNRLVT